MWHAGDEIMFRFSKEIVRLLNCDVMPLSSTAFSRVTGLKDRRVPLVSVCVINFGK